MARSKRSYRRSTSQRTVSLFASFLPAPLQRIAETQLGSTILMLGIPALIVAGILQLEWNGGLPQLKIDRNRAQEIRNAAREEITRISSPETVQTIQRLERSAVDLWHASQGSTSGGYPAPTHPANASYPASSNSVNGYPAAYPHPNGGYDYRNVSQQLPLPTSSVAKPSSSQSQWPNATTPNAYPNALGHNQQPYAQPSSYPAYPTTPPPASYPPQQQPVYYQQPQYQQPQPNYYQPSATAVYQQSVAPQPATGRVPRY